ncbi:MAG: peptidoglycan-associated lipoprotein Pal [Candidatus Macondimonas sp.]
MKIFGSESTMGQFPKFMVVGVMVLALAGCAGSSKKATKGAAGGEWAAGAGGAETSPLAEGGGLKGDEWGAVQSATAGNSGYGSPTDPRAAALQSQVIYFEYDSSVVAPQYMEVVRTHGEYLKKNPNVRANLEGHTDERGSREYNIALGQRRSDAVMNLLIAQGVSASQLSSVSFGEEKPAVYGSSEDTWSKNRRVEVRYAP